MTPGSDGAVHRLRRRGAAGQRGHHWHPGDRLRRAEGRQYRRRDREHDPDGERPPRQVRRVDHVAGRLLQRRHVGEPGGEAERRPGQRAGHADGQAIGDHDEAEAAFGRADRAEHAEGTEPALGHHGEAGDRHQADEHQAEYLHQQDDRRRREPARAAGGEGHSRRRDTGQRPVAAADRLLRRGRADQHDHLAGVRDLAGGDQRELVRQVARVLHDAGHPPGHAGRLPCAAHVRVVQGRYLAGQRDLPGAGRVGAADQAEQRRVVVPVRTLGAELHRLGGAGSDVLGLDEIGRTPVVLDGGDVGGQVRVGAGQRDRRGGGAERRVVRVRELRVRDHAGAPDRRGDRHGEQAEHEQLLAPFAAEQPPAPAHHRASGGYASGARARAGQCGAHRSCRSSDSGPGAGLARSTMRPSLMNTTRSAHEASCASCVTTTAAMPSLARGADHAHHRLAVGRVQRAGRLVGEQQVPVTDHRAGDRHPLSLAAGQLIRVARRAVRQAERIQRAQAGLPRLPRADAVQFQRQRHVLRGGQPRQQVEVLEHVADRPAAQPRLVVARHRGQVLPGDQDLPAGRLLQAAGDGQQRRLARAARPHHRHHRPGGDFETDLPQRVDLGGALAVRLGHLTQFQHALAASQHSCGKGRPGAVALASAPLCNLQPAVFRPPFIRAG